MRPLILLLTLLGGLACSRDLGIPAPPEKPAFTVGTFAPAHGYAGTRVIIQVSNVGTDPSGVDVRFGTSGAVAPARLTSSTLEVIVPADASSGAITVTAPLGTAKTSVAFAFDGVGHLHFGRIAAQADLRAHVRTALPFGTDGTLALLDDAYLWAGTITPFGVRTQLDLHVPLVIAGNGTSLLVFDEDFSAPGCPDFSAHLTILGGAKVCLPFGNVDPADVIGAAMAIDAAATHAFIATDLPLGFLVDLTAAPPQVTQVATTTTLLGLVQVAWLPGSTRFIYVDDDNLRSLDWTTGTSTDEFQVGAPPEALAVDGSGKIAVGDEGGRVRLFTGAASWPPTQVAQVSTFSATFVGGLAFSDDGNTLAVSQEFADHVVTFDVSTPASPALLLSAPVTQASTITASGGAMLVGGLGGVTVLSQRTGGLISFLPLGTQPGLPHQRIDPLSKAPVLSVPLYTFNTLAQFDPLTLTNVPWTGSLSLPPTLAFDALPDGTGLFLHDGELRRSSIVAGREVEEAAHAFTFPPASGFAEPARLTAAPDGSAVLLQWDTGTLGSKEVLAVLDPHGTWSAPALQIDVPDAVEPPLVEGNHFGLPSMDKLEVRDLAAALLGQDNLVGTMALPGSEYATSHALGKTFSAVAPSAGGTLLQIGLLSDASLIPPSPLPAFDRGYRGSFTVAQGGRRLYWLSGGDTTKRLITVEVDPDTGEVGAEEPPIALGTADAIYACPDGAHLVVVDSTNDRLLLLE